MNEAIYDECRCRLWKKSNFKKVNHLVLVTLIDFARFSAAFSSFRIFLYNCTVYSTTPSHERLGHKMNANQNLYTKKIIEKILIYLYR